MTTDIVLVESRAAREDHLNQMRQDQAQGILDQVKGLVFAMWRGQHVATTAQVADFYEVPEDCLCEVLSSHAEEFSEEWLIAVMSLGDQLFDSRQGRDFLMQLTKESRLLYLQHTRWIDLVDPPKESFVYFVLDTGNKLIKIGFSRSVETRLASLQMGNSNPLRLLATLNGGRKEEYQLHKRFAKQRVRSEWFKDCKEIRDFIATIPAPKNVSSCADSIWTPRAAIRLAMLLRDSPVASQVRKAFL